MALLSIQNLSLGYGGTPLLNEVTLQVEPGERICLIGRNGAGKSTLLKVVAGALRPDTGLVDAQKGLRVGLLPQEIPDDLEGGAFDIAASGLPEPEAAHDNPETRAGIEAVLTRLKVRSDLPFGQMSGGMKRRVLLARALAGEPDVLLLDEPTNHLDIDTIAWLEGFLARRQQALLFVSHDRAFVDAVATRIAELDRGVLSSWPGGYTDYLRRKQEALVAEAKAKDRFDKKLKEEEAWIRQGIKARRTRNEGRVRALEKMREIKRAELSALGSVSLRASSASASGKRVIEAKGITFSYPGIPIVKELDTIIQRGEKVGLIGPNGSGKTTLLKLLLGELEPEAGTVRHGARVASAHLDQLRDAVDDEKTLIENLVDRGDTVETGGQKQHVISYLKDFLFTPEAARAPARNLSGGEKNRLMLAKLFTRPANVLVLDEPTNDLDIDTLELLESLLVEFDGTVLVVSHDRTFLNRVATSTLVFEGEGRVREYAGGYDDWLLQRDPEPAPRPKPVKKPREKPKPEGPKRLTFKERQELEKLPALIEAAEAELEELREKMARADFYQQDSETIKAAIARMEALEPHLEQRYARWEDLEGRAGVK